MHRCLELAVLGMGKVAPNPMVGSVLIHDDKIIGEGYHQLYGEAHAEVNCIGSVKEEHLSLIAKSVLYVSLEPCAHFGKTPPCADLIIKNKIPKVIVGCRDPFVQVNGKGIEKLRAAGIEVIDGVLEKRCKELNKRFFVFHTEHRPYIILKWAETGDKKMSLPAPFRLPPVGGATNTQYPLSQENFYNNKDAQLSEPLSAGEASSNGGGLRKVGGREGASRLLISNEYTNRLVHKWRSEEMAILVGTNTALFDDPSLTTRLWPGTNPIRIVVDMNLRLPQSLKLFDGKAPTIIFNLHRHTLPFEKISATDLREIGVGYYQVTEYVNLIHQMLNALYLMNIQSVIVEGGAQLLQSFIDDGSWDEARIITNEKLVIGNGLPSPVLKDDQLTSTQTIDADFIRIYHQTVK
jgi:diaminohydroxyphosphoribosylaminopyrimidine deaminase / 5-amino-6-(5-phosphoribosylamino)uracil reductase